MAEPEKVFIKVDGDTDVDELADRLLEALFGREGEPLTQPE